MRTLAARLAKKAAKHQAFILSPAGGKQRLEHWRSHADLTSVRDPAALERLADPERAAWQALWRDVDELTTRTAKKTD